MLDKTDRLLNIPEVRARSGMSRASIYRKLKDGQLLAVKIGRSTRIRESDLARFMAELKPYGASVREAR